MIFEVWTEPVDYKRRMHLTISARVDGSDNVAYAEPLVFRTIPIEEELGKPTMDLRRDEAMQLLQAFLDHAWRLGLRPAGHADRPAQVAALQDHLKDMQEISFRLLDTVAPQRAILAEASRDDRR